jgi:hypothetical protein
MGASDSFAWFAAPRNQSRVAACRDAHADTKPALAARIRSAADGPLRIPGPIRCRAGANLVGVAPQIQNPDSGNTVPGSPPREVPIMKWFGSPWSSPLCRDCPRVPVPVGKLCKHCGEAIGAGDSGVVYSDGLSAHRNCSLRAVAGSTEGDPPA